MISFLKKTLIVLPHLDDEFALFPIIKVFKNLENISIIYCSERNQDLKNKKKRRLENIKSLSMFGIKKTSIIYINDFFYVHDNFLFKKTTKIFDFIENLYHKDFYQQILTLNLEGGHPDHDCLALIVNQIKKKYNIDTFFFPAYNYRNNFIFPFSVLRPLVSQESVAIKLQFKRFFWFDLLRIAFTYRTERKAFFKLILAFFYKIAFSDKMLFFDHVSLSYINWEETLSFKRYKVEKNLILEKIKDL